MKRWHVVLAGSLLGLLLYTFQKYHTRTLAAERAIAAGAIVAAQEAFDSADAAETRAQAAELRAQAAERRRSSLAPARRAIVAQAPDTCAPAITALRGELADADSTTAGLRDALEEQKAAAAKLRAAGETVVAAADDLVKSTGGSFLKDIIPDVGVGLAVGPSATLGVNPTTGLPATAVGVGATLGITLSWDF
jgi:hypothetical protein